MGAVRIETDLTTLIRETATERGLSLAGLDRACGTGQGLRNVISNANRGLSKANQERFAVFLGWTLTAVCELDALHRDQKREARELKKGNGLVDLSEAALPVRTLTGWVLQPPRRREGRRMTCATCDVCTECRRLVLTGNPALCERILERELAGGIMSVIRPGRCEDGSTGYDAEGISGEIEEKLQSVAAGAV